MLTIFAWVRVPVFLIAFVWAHRFYRRKITVAAALPLLGLLITTAGDLCGNWFRACFFFGAAHLCWFAFLIRRGRFSWQTAGLLTIFMLPRLGTVVLPAVDDAHEFAFVWYAFCTVISVAAAVGARRSPGGVFYVAGTATLMVSDVCIGLHLAGIRFATHAIAPLYVTALGLLLVALWRGVPEPPPEPELSPPLVSQHRNALTMAVAGSLLPVFFIAAMLLFNGKYCWYTDFISRSGLVIAGKGRPNHLAAWLLTTGLAGSAVLCGWYFIERFRWGKAPLWQRSVVMFFGVLGAVGLAGIGLLPFDQHPDLHNFCTLCTVPFGIAIIFSAPTPDDQFGRRSEKAIWLVFILFILAVIGGLTYLIGHKPRGLPFTPMAQFVQKMTVLAFYIYMMGQVTAYAINTRLAPSEANRP